MGDTRQARIQRRTTETDIDLTFVVDGAGASSINTGVGFFDHMLTAFSRHGLFDLTLSCKGDLEVDAHHTVEDVGICLEQAVAEALAEAIDATDTLRLDATPTGGGQLQIEVAVPAANIELADNFGADGQATHGLRLYINLDLVKA